MHISQYRGSSRGKPNLILDISFELAVDVARFCDFLNVQKRYSLSNQLFRAGTSVGANVREAQDAESRADFIHKLKIASKEAHETAYWLELAQALDKKYETASLLEKTDRVSQILDKIISSSRKNKNNTLEHEPT